MYPWIRAANDQGGEAMSGDHKLADSILCEQCRGTATLEHGEDFRRASEAEFVFGMSDMIIEATDAYVCTQCGWRKVVKHETYPM